MTLCLSQFFVSTQGDRPLCPGSRGKGPRQRCLARRELGSRLRSWASHFTPQSLCFLFCGTKRPGGAEGSLPELSPGAPASPGSNEGAEPRQAGRGGASCSRAASGPGTPAPRARLLTPAPPPAPPRTLGGAAFPCAADSAHSRLPAGCFARRSPPDPGRAGPAPAAQGKAVEAPLPGRRLLGALRDVRALRWGLGRREGPQTAWEPGWRGRGCC